MKCKPLWNRRSVLKTVGAGVLGALAAPDAAAAPEPKPSDWTPLIEGYPDQLSYQAGDQVVLHVSTRAPTYAVEIVREGLKREVVWHKDSLSGEHHPTPKNASTHGCGWPGTVKVPVPPEWRSGFYRVTLRAAGKAGRPENALAFFVVRPVRPGKDTRILWVLTTNTYNAYNDWGGSSLYVSGPLPLQGARVSFDRPLSPGLLDKPTDRPLSHWHPYAGWHNWERLFLAWAERHGYQLDYAVNSDLEFHPEVLKPYRLVLSVGHDEYWSAPMRDHLEAFIGNGGNGVFFSGNTCYWQVRSEDKGRALVCYKYRPEKDPYFKNGPHALLASLWAHHLVKRPENGLTGVSFNYAGYHRYGSVPQGAGGYTVHRPEHWAFEGTKLQWGDLLGAKDKVVGYECDGCEFTVEDGLPVPTHRDGTPANFQILATAPAALWDSDVAFTSRSLFGPGTKKRRKLGAAVMGAYTRGGTVFTTGCTEWVRGLAGKDALVERITRNVIDRLKG
jgi:hypothetical protein